MGKLDKNRFGIDGVIMMYGKDMGGALVVR